MSKDTTGGCPIIPMEGTVGSIEPEITIVEDHSWFWSKEWQKGERRVDRAILAGRVIGLFNDIEELIKSLKE